MGPMQFEFMKIQGLQPRHRLLEIGCGSLRAGRFFIPYLDADNYMGFDMDEQLVKKGLAKEVAPEFIASKRPCFVFNDRFDFAPFHHKSDLAISQSVFTHLTPTQIVICLKNLKSFAPACRLFATFNEARFPIPNGLFAPHPQRTFYYSKRQLSALAKAAGWRMNYIGEWGHPRSQKMAEFIAT
jgi:hypothetical protein